MKKLTAAELGNPTLRGSVYRGTHKLAVIGVLGDRAPKVSSRGNQFFNVDRWTVRVFVREMCKWAQGNAQCVPTRKEVDKWVRAANLERVPNREIVIDQTPDKLTLRTALALTGGAYHEAFHTYYSCLRSLSTDEMAAIVLPRWAKVPDWSKFYVLLQEWSNIIEDILIERWGRVEFPGSLMKLHDLQDFILKQEGQGVAGTKAHSGGKSTRSALSIITATFRDVGLGYNTTTQREALEKYRTPANSRLAETCYALVSIRGSGEEELKMLAGILGDENRTQQEWAAAARYLIALGATAAPVESLVKERMPLLLPKYPTVKNNLEKSFFKRIKENGRPLRLVQR